MSSFCFFNYSAAGRRDKYYQQYLDMLDEGCSLLPNVIIQEVYMFLFIVVQVWHIERLLVHTRTVFMSFYGNSEARQILSYTEVCELQ
jgi:hypothetical protein